MRSKLLFGIALMFAGVSVSGQEIKQLKTDYVSIFRNNSAYFQRSGVTNGNGIYQFIGKKNIPMARYGTFWVTSKGNLEAIRSYEIDKKYTDEEDASTMSELLLANIGNDAVLRTASDNNYIGKIAKVEEGTNGMLVYVIDTRNKWVAIPLEQIELLEFSEQPKTKYKNERESTERVVEVRFEDKKKVPFEISYLEYGLSWNPFYKITLENNSELSLKLVAEVVNDAEDIVNADVNFVSGMPTFRYISQLTDLISEKSPGYKSYERKISSNYRTAYMEDSDYDESEAIIEFGGSSSKVEISEAKEQKYYTLKNLSLKTGERAHFDIFNTRLRYKNIYTCYIANRVRDSRDGENNIVYYSLLIENEDDYWLAAAPAFVDAYAGDKLVPLAQNLLKDTPKNGTSQINISQTHDIKVEDGVLVVKRFDENEEYRGSMRAKEKMKGKLIIQNFKNTDATLRITSVIEGELIDSKIKWNILSQESAYDSLNVENNVEWNIDVKAGETFEIEYFYYRYIKKNN